MRKLLDRLFFRRKLSIILPLATAALFYLLFIVFGEEENKAFLVLATPLLSLLWFWGTFLVLYIQVKNPSCPEWFLNTFEVMTLLAFGSAAVFTGVGFLMNLKEGFSPAICLGMITWSSLSLYTVKGRTEQERLRY